VPHGGEGANVSAPIAGKIIRDYFHLSSKPQLLKQADWYSGMTTAVSF